MKYTSSIVLAAFLYGASSIQLNQMSSISLADDEGAEVAHEVEEGEALEEGDAVVDEETAEALDESAEHENESGDEEEVEGETEGSESEEED
jgi:hypothetical protein